MAALPSHQALMWGAALLSACSGGGVSEAPTSAVSEPILAAACVLPGERPGSLTVEVVQTTIPRGGVPQTRSLIRSEVCPADAPTCVAISAERFDAVYARVLEIGFGSLGTREVGQASPHYGIRTVTLSWAGGEPCAVSDGPRHALPTAESKALRSLISSIRSLE